MKSVVILFAAPDAKQVGLLKLLLERHGIEVEACSSGPALKNPLRLSGVDLVLLMISARATLDRTFAGCCDAILASGAEPRAVRIDETFPDAIDARLRSVGSYDYSVDGLTAMFADLDSAFLPMTRLLRFDERKGDERRTWNLRRYRYGLWLAFSRRTGAGKFDPYPLTLSKRVKTNEALMGEVASYRYVDPVTEAPVASERVLSDALLSVWENTADIAPNAIRVIEATAEEIWNRYSPSMAKRQRTA